MAIQPSQKTRQKRSDEFEGSQTVTQRSKDWRRDAIGDGPCSLDVLIRWLEFGDNFRTFQHGKKHLKKGQAAQQASDWMQRHGCPTYRDADAVMTKLCLN